ncbi:MAG: hypothetical protein B7X60_01645 [Polynucleobacter sp. 39-45-136]|jgi:hypothetical protein|nr:MAG: hypothetical protein B7X60_01645 [Polynucleobacter sp. 39-45-136]
MLFLMKEKIVQKTSQAQDMNKSEDPQETPEVALRRAALKKIVKYSAYASPALIATISGKAAAQVS